MVHALKDIWRVLKKDAFLIDLRPIPKAQSIDLIRGNELIERKFFDDAYRIKNDKAANSAIATVQDTFFRLEHSHPFPFKKSNLFRSPDKTTLPDIIPLKAIDESIRLLVKAPKSNPFHSKFQTCHLL